jgi:hypothetical protein
VLHVDGLKNRLEALSSPQLVSAFNSMDVNKSKFFVRIFADMDRSPELVKYYRKCIRAKLLKIWVQIVEETEMEVGEVTVLQWTHKFFEAVVRNVQEQVCVFFNLYSERVVQSTFENWTVRFSNGHFLDKICVRFSNGLLAPFFQSSFQMVG